MWIIEARRTKENEIFLNLAALKEECEAILESFLKYMADGEVFGDIGLSAVNMSGAYLRSSSFQGALFNGIKLAGADISYADFSGGRFQDIGWNDQNDNAPIVCNNAVFEKVKFIQINLQNANCKNAVFRDAELSDVLLSGNEKNETCFEGSNFEHANFMDVGHKIEFVNFTGAVFCGALLSTVKFFHCNFKGADFSDAICQSTNFQKCNIEDGNLERISAYSSKWNSVTIPRGCIAHANFAGATLVECDLRSAYVNDSTYTNGKLTNCHFEGTVFRRTDFTGAEITGCRLQFVDLQEAVFNGDFPPAKADDESVLVQIIKNCQFDGANLSNAQIRNCKFFNCSFSDCFFDSALLQNVTFESCSFANAQFRDTVIMDVLFGVTGDAWAALQQQLQEAIICKNKKASTSLRKVLPMCKTYSPAEEKTVAGVIAKRKSNRCFLRDRTVERKHLQLILEAALLAPSPKNRQPWHFFVVNSEQKEMLRTIMDKELARLERQRIEKGKMVTDLKSARLSADCMADSSVTVLVCYERDISNNDDDKMTWELDAQGFETCDLQSIGAAVENMILQATELGIASLWIGDILYAHDAVQSYFGLRYPIVAAVALGYEAPHHCGRKKLEEKVEWIHE